MIQYAKTILWMNIAIVIFFILTVLNVEFFNINLLDGILTFIHEVLIFPIAAAVILSFLFSIFFIFKKENSVLKVLLLLMALLNIFLTFILPGLKNL